MATTPCHSRTAAPNPKANAWNRLRVAQLGLSSCSSTLHAAVGKYPAWNCCCESSKPPWRGPRRQLQAASRPVTARPGWRLRAKETNRRSARRRAPRVATSPGEPLTALAGQKYLPQRYSVPAHEPKDGDLRRPDLREMTTWFHHWRWDTCDVHSTPDFGLCRDAAASLSSGFKAERVLTAELVRLSLARGTRQGWPCGNPNRGRMSTACPLCPRYLGEAPRGLLADGTFAITVA